MSEVHIILGHESPGDENVPVAAFTDYQQAREAVAAWTTYEKTFPQTPTMTRGADREAYEEVVRKWKRAHPGGIDVAEYGYFHISTVPLTGA